MPSLILIYYSEVKWEKVWKKIQFEMTFITREIPPAVLIGSGSLPARPCDPGPAACRPGGIRLS